MALNTQIPAIINDLIVRLRAEAVTDSQTAVVEALDNIGRVYWYNLLAKLNMLVDAIKLYQLFLIDGDLQDMIDDLDRIYFYDLFRKVRVLIEATELIETL